MNANEKRDLEENDIIEQMEEEIEQIQDEEGQIDESKLDESKLEENNSTPNDLLAKTMADFDNYKKRVARDREEMIYFLKADILKVILPRVDDLERIIQNTPKELQGNPLYEGVVSTLLKLLQDLEKMGVKPFISIGEEVNPDLHDVMTIIPGKKENIIIDEFEKGYMLADKLLRHAKVVSGGGE